ncbi:methyltransferase, TIGR04325 family [Leptospira sp. 96542]|nr:methyltransferase, TIGR04325 family [Leptospira sp. 96542]
MFWFQGKYNSWAEALSNAKGYSDLAIFEKVKNSVMKVKTGEAIFERDSVAFDKQEFAYPLSLYLFYASTALQNELTVLDFGGSLGSSYFQNRALFSCLKQIRWHVIEQDHFVEFGKNELESKQLQFSNDFNTLLFDSNYRIALFSASLQYIETWRQLLEDISKSEIEFLILDRIPILKQSQNTIITVQHVPSYIYEASYPCYLFNQYELEELVLDSFDKVFELPGMDNLKLKGIEVQYKSVLYRRKKAEKF